MTKTASNMMPRAITTNGYGLGYNENGIPVTMDKFKINPKEFIDNFYSFDITDKNSFDQREQSILEVFKKYEIQKEKNITVSGNGYFTNYDKEIQTLKERQSTIADLQLYVELFSRAIANKYLKEEKYTKASMHQGYFWNNGGISSDGGNQGIFYITYGIRDTKGIYALKANKGENGKILFSVVGNNKGEDVKYSKPMELEDALKAFFGIISKKEEETNEYYGQHN